MNITPDQEDAKRKMTDYLRATFMLVVDNPEELKIQIYQGERTTVYELRCSPNDIGKVLGRKGKFAGAVRQILSSWAGRNGLRAVLEIISH